MDLEDQQLATRLLLRDHDAKFFRSFDESLELTRVQPPLPQRVVKVIRP